MDRPNILVIWGDDISFWNLSTNNMGMMDQNRILIALPLKAPFTDYYGRKVVPQALALLRAIADSHRLTKVGCPPTTSVSVRTSHATLLKSRAATGQFARFHLGDRDEFLPQHGFDEFFGNLYHLNAEKSLKILTTRRTRLFRRPGPVGRSTVCRWPRDRHRSAK